MKNLKLTTVLLLLIFGVNSCQVDNELQNEEQITLELEKSSSQRSERSREGSRACSSITVTSSWITVNYDQYTLIKNSIIEEGFTLLGNPDCQAIYTGNNQSPQWENEVVASMQFIGEVDDTVRFRIKDLKIACFDCPSPTAPTIPSILCSYIGQNLKVTVGNQCILGVFQLTEASTNNANIDFISFIIPQYCEVCDVIGDGL